LVILEDAEDAEDADFLEDVEGVEDDGIVVVSISGPSDNIESGMILYSSSMSCADGASSTHIDSNSSIVYSSSIGKEVSEIEGREGTAIGRETSADEGKADGFKLNDCGRREGTADSFKSNDRLIST